VCALRHDAATSIAGPNRSTAWPLVRTRARGIRSTIVTTNPCRLSQYAAVEPATLAPEIRTRNGREGMFPVIGCGALGGHTRCLSRCQSERS